MKHIVTLLVFALSMIAVPSFAMAPKPDANAQARADRIATQAQLQTRFANLDARFEAAKARLTSAQIATLQPLRNAVQVGWLNYDGTAGHDVATFDAAEKAFNDKLASFGG